MTPALAALAFAALTVAEVRRPLRASREPKRRRLTRNLAIGGVAQAVGVPLQLVLVAPLAELVERRGIGLLHVLALPDWLAACLGVLLLDYTLWHWHRMNHRVPVLWRFHAVHHADVDLDASTALRFHVGEMAFGAAWRVLQVVVIGVGPVGLSIYTMLLWVSILFHHSNLALPAAFERRLVRVLATPRMHGIHHSVEQAERDSNYASLLTAWDVMHGTLRLNIPQREVTIGLPEAYASARHAFGPMLLFPFRRQPARGLAMNPEPARREPASPRGRLEA